MFRPRPAQSEVLAYEGGFLAVSAVHGSGKTVTLAALAARLLARGLPEESAVLVVTYMNSAVDNLAHAIARRLEEEGIRRGRYEVRTLHSLSREIVLEQPGLAGVVPDFPVLDERTSQALLERALERWLEEHPWIWEVLEAEKAEARQFWRDRLHEMALAVIEVAKNRRWRPQAILARLPPRPPEEEGAGPSSLEFLRMAAEIYALYQSYVESSGGLDFDDLVWRAVDLLERYPDFLARLRRRWPFILEDEAQDSVPLQEELLYLLAGPQGNWVRVGDPNQAITSTFTAAHPRYFRAFMERPGVRTITMTQTGRCAPRIMALANYLVEWVSGRHPLPEVRERTFRRQAMEPVPPDDPQPNPPDEENNVAIHVSGYARREGEELPRLARLLERYRRRYPERTLAVLVPTNEVGYRMAGVLSARGLPYDELLETSSQARGVAGVLAALLSFAAAPQRPERTAHAFEVLVEQGWLVLPGEEDRMRLFRLLRSCRPETLLFPAAGEEPRQALPAGRALPQDLELLAPFLELLRRALLAAPLPIEQLVLLLAAEVFSRPDELATAQQVAAHLRHLAEADPSLRLPDLAAELERIGRGERRFVGLSEDDLGFTPRPGRITVATQHRAKGLEWDFVCLAGIDRFWVPHDLEQAFLGSYPELGGNPTATVQAQLRGLMGEAGAPPDISQATRQANLETISERLRLLYVGITRARRHLQISWSRAVELYGRERPQEGTPVLQELGRFLRRGGCHEGPKPPGIKSW